MAAMPSSAKLSDQEERILLALWRLRGIGRNAVKEDALNADLSKEVPSESWLDKISGLNKLGFLEANNIDGQNAFSLTPLGLAILRQIEEDRLQELK